MSTEAVTSSAGAICDDVGLDGRTPLELARHLGREEVVEVLEAAGR